MHKENTQTYMALTNLEERTEGTHQKFEENDRRTQQHNKAKCSYTVPAIHVTSSILDYT